MYTLLGYHEITMVEVISLAEFYAWEAAHGGKKGKEEAAAYASAGAGACGR
jgi:hypothetical protein